MMFTADELLKKINEFLDHLPYGGMLPPIPLSTNVLGRSFLTPYARWGYAGQLHGDTCDLHARTHARTNKIIGVGSKSSTEQQMSVFI